MTAPRAENPRTDALHIAAGTPEPGTLVLTVSGELDLATAPRLDAILAATVLLERHRLVVVDLTGVGFLGVAGITALMRHHDRALEHGIGFRLVASSRAVLRPLDLLELTGAFDIHPTVGSALR
ncbi:STAS domain-containing protein [Actinokineospora sp. NPDC004072]